MVDFDRNKNRGRSLILISLILAALLILPALSSPPGPQQERRAKPSPVEHHEIPDDAYIPVPRESMQRSPAYRFFSADFFTVQVNVDQFGQNIVGDAANEPSIAMDPTDPSRIVIGWRQFDTVNNNFRQAGYGYSADGGQTWTFPGVIEPGVFRSDPVLDSDAEGQFYYNSLTNTPDYFCTVFKSTDGGATWDGGTPAHGGDKQWMVVDKTNGVGKGHFYSFWTQFFSTCPPGFFTRSSDNSVSYENCITVPDEPFWGTLAVGSEGELYVAGVGPTDFVVAKSTTARDSGQTITWDFAPIVSLGGDPVSFAGSSSPNPGGLHGQAWVATDNSGGLNHGNVYLLCSVEPFSSVDPCDVMFSRSTDGGITWSSPLRINDDPSTNAWQWFGTMSVAPDGRIDVIWLDTRDNPGSVFSSLYYSYSTDAGVTWSANERLTNAFNPHLGWPQQNKMGDYFHMISDQTGVHLAWANTFNGEQDVYYAHISPQLVAIGDLPGEPGIPEKFSLEQNYPNPFNPSTTIRYQLPEKGFVTLKVYNLGGQEIMTLVNGEQGAGPYQVKFDGSGFAGGIYFYRLRVSASSGQIGELSETRKLVLLK